MSEYLNSPEYFAALNPGGRIPADVLQRAGASYDASGQLMPPPIRTVQDFLRYVDALGPYADPASKRQADQVRQNPGQYNANGGSVQANLPPWWDVPLKAGLAAVTAGLIPGGGAPVANAGASASAGGTLGPATSIPGLHAAVPGALTAGGNLAGAAGAATGGAGLLTAGNNAINDVIDRGGSAPLGGITPPRDLAGRVSEWFTDPRNLVGLASIVPSLIAARGGGGNSASTDAAMNQANRMSAITEARMRRVDPLHQAVTQLAFGRLPVSSRNGVNLTNVPLPE